MDETPATPARTSYLLPPLTIIRHKRPFLLEGGDFFDYTESPDSTLLARFFYTSPMPYIVFSGAASRMSFVYGPFSQIPNTTRIEQAITIDKGEILIKSTLESVLKRKIEITKAEAEDGEREFEMTEKQLASNERERWSRRRVVEDTVWMWVLALLAFGPVLYLIWRAL
jgi:hypothetical protein